VDVAAAEAAGIAVRNVPGYCVDEVADHALALLLALRRQIVHMVNGTAAGGWREARPVRPIHRISGQTMGLVGAGRIGTAIARRARGFGMRTVASDPYRAGPADPELPIAAFADVLAAADVLVLCAPLNDSTRGIIDAAALARLRPGAELINVARGGLVVEADLADALRSGHLGGAALDVRVSEPPDPATDPLRDCPNLMLTPHQAATSEESVLDLRDGVVRQALDLLDGPPHGPAAGVSG
jgi:D-3-phosphoglycerate dehydrogenase